MSHEVCTSFPLITLWGPPAHTSGHVPSRCIMACTQPMTPTSQPCVTACPMRRLVKHGKGTSVTLKIVNSSKQGYESASYLAGADAGAPVACSGAALSTYSEFGVLSSTCSAQNDEVMAGMVFYICLQNRGSRVSLTTGFWGASAGWLAYACSTRLLPRGLTVLSCGLRPRAGAVSRKCQFWLRGMQP